MIPHLRLAIFAAVALLCFGTGWKLNGWRHDSLDLVAMQAAEKAGERATTAAVDAIKTLRPQFTTIYRPLEKEIRNEARYTSAECSHTPDAWGLLDKAYQAAGGEPFGSGTGVQPATAAP